jgi:hypothetical protein
VGTLSDDIKSLAMAAQAFEVPKFESFRPPKLYFPAEEAFDALGRYVKEFEAALDQDHEIGARLVSFGQTVKFHIERIDFTGRDIVTFYGVNEDNERVQLIQNVSQLSVLLVAMTKTGDKARRIGFIWDDETEAP